MKNYFFLKRVWSLVFICLIFTSLHSDIFESPHYPKGSGFSATFNQINSQPKNFSFQIRPFVVQQDPLSHKQVLCIKLLELLQQPSPDQFEVRHALVEQLYVVVMQLLQYSHTQSDLDKLLCLKSQCEERLRELTEAMHVVNNNEISFKNHVFLQKLKVAFAELSPDDYEQRINALDQAIAQPLANIDRTYQLSSEVYHYNPHAELFEHCSGNALEQQLHQELFDTVTEMARLLEQNPHNLYVQTNSEFVFHVTALAKVQKDPEVGFNLLDCGKSLLKFTQNLVGIVAQETVYMRIEMSARTIHGHPITEVEYRYLTKKR